MAIIRSSSRESTDFEVFVRRCLGWHVELPIVRMDGRIFIGIGFVSHHLHEGRGVTLLFG